MKVEDLVIRLSIEGAETRKITVGKGELLAIIRPPDSSHVENEKWELVRIAIQRHLGIDVLIVPHGTEFLVVEPEKQQAATDGGIEMLQG